MGPNTDPPRAARVAVALCFALCGELFATWVTRIPAIQAKLGMSHATLGLVLLSSSAGALVAMPLTGSAIAHFGSKRVLQIVATLFVFSLPWLATAGTPLLLALALFLLGATYGGLDVAMNAQAVAVEERYGRPIMGSFHALFSLGGLVGAAAGGVVAKAGYSPLVHFCGAAGVLGLPTLLIALPLLLPTRRTVQAPAHRRGFTLPPRSLLAIGALAFCCMMAEGSVADWSALFLSRDLGTNEGTAAGGFAAFSIAMAVARFGGDSLAALLGPATVIRWGAALAATGLAIALAVGQTGVALAGFAAMGIGLAPIIPLLFSAAGRTPGMDPGTSLSVTTTLGYAGFLLGPPLIGFIAQGSSLRQALAIIVVMSLVVAIFTPHAQLGGPKASTP